MIDPDRLEQAAPELIRRSGWTDNAPEQPVPPLDPDRQEQWQAVFDAPVRRSRPILWGSLGATGLTAAALVVALLQNAPLPAPEALAPGRPPLPTPEAPAARRAAPPLVEAPAPRRSPLPLPKPQRPSAPTPKAVPPPALRGSPVPRPDDQDVLPEVTVDGWQRATPADGSTAVRRYVEQLCERLRARSATLPEGGAFAVLGVTVGLQQGQVGLRAPVQLLEGEVSFLSEAAIQLFNELTPEPAPEAPATSVRYRVNLFSTPGLVTCEAETAH